MTMARKLTCEEAKAFEEAIVGTRTSLSKEANLFGNLETKRDAAMALSPELGVWFDVELPFRS